MVGERVEIGNHTLTHRLFDEIEEAEMRAELEAIESRCAARGIARPTSFAHTAYRTHPAALDLLRGKGYRFAPVGGSRPYVPRADDPLLVPGFSTTGTDRGRVLAALEQARCGTWRGTSEGPRALYPFSARTISSQS